MQYCQKCWIIIRGNKRCCPLCQSNLSGEPDEDVFPDLVRKKVSSVMLTRICLSGSISLPFASRKEMSTA